jgi:NACalpha-BTF3-like transcription factor
VFTVRAIDFSRGIFVPAVEFDDEKYPDDIELISENADASKIEQYRKALLEDAREYQNVTTDREVIRESAMGDTVQVFASAMRDVRDADINLSQMDDEQVMVQAEQLAKDAQGALNEQGGSDE